MSTARNSPPNLAILDWMLPELDGLEVCKRLPHYQGDGERRYPGGAVFRRRRAGARMALLDIMA